MQPEVRNRIPNLLTLARLVLAAVFFVLLSTYQATDQPGQGVETLNVATLLFIAAAVTDALDGFLARRWNAITTFGRVMDPVADKVLVLGAFVFLAGPAFIVQAAPELGSDLATTGAAAGEAGRDLTTSPATGPLSGVYPWMVVVILARELLVTAIRGVAESAGIQFPAVWSGKIKMILQSITVPVVLLIAANFNPAETAWAAWTRDILVWATVLVTIASGVTYSVRGRLLLSPQAEMQPN
jgi:CDP-diacylglycerol--glycerol-3-phosphate 3-phosphatidyltransferase